MSPALSRADPTLVSFQTLNRLRGMQVDNFDSIEMTNLCDLQEFNIRLANSEGRREAATMLLKKMYAWRGYDIEVPKAGEPDCITLTADTGGETVGTMTLCFDGEAGLPADHTFREELDILRGQSKVLCEPSRLAIDKETPVRVLAALWHISYIYCHNIHHCTDYIIEVNPRHAMFYKRMLGFKEFGAQRICERVNAPAILLRLECAYVKSQVKRFGGLYDKSENERSFYPHCFSSGDEAGIEGRLISGRT